MAEKAITSERDRNDDLRSASQGRCPVQRLLATTLLIGVVCWAGAPALAGNGPGIGFKIGAQTLEHPVSQRDTTRTRYEIELSSQVFLDDHLDFALTVGGSSLGSFNDDYVDVIDGVLLEEYYSDRPIGHRYSSGGATLPLGRQPTHSALPRSGRRLLLVPRFLGRPVL